MPTHLDRVSWLYRQIAASARLSVHIGWRTVDGEALRHQDGVLDVRGERKAGPRRVDNKEGVAEQLKAAGLRPEVDDHDDTVGEKVRRAITSKVPAVLVVGDDDVAGSTTGLRLRESEKEERGVSVADAVARLSELCAAPR